MGNKTSSSIASFCKINFRPFCELHKQKFILPPCDRDAIDPKGFFNQNLLLQVPSSRWRINKLNFVAAESYVVNTLSRLRFRFRMTGRPRSSAVCTLFPFSTDKSQTAPAEWSTKCSQGSLESKRKCFKSQKLFQAWVMISPGWSCHRLSIHKWTTATSQRTKQWLSAVARLQCFLKRWRVSV